MQVHLAEYFSAENEGHTSSGTIREAAEHEIAFRAKQVGGKELWFIENDPVHKVCLDLNNIITKK